MLTSPERHTVDLPCYTDWTECYICQDVKKGEPDLKPYRKSGKHNVFT